MNVLLETTTNRKWMKYTVVVMTNFKKKG